MAQLTITANVADARSLGGDWQRYVQITNTSSATEIKLSRGVRTVYIQPDTDDLLIDTEGTAGVALDAAGFDTDAGITREVLVQHPERAHDSAVVPAGASLFLQPGTNPTNVSIRAVSRR